MPAKVSEETNDTSNMEDHSLTPSKKSKKNKKEKKDKENKKKKKEKRKAENSEVNETEEQPRKKIKKEKNENKSDSENNSETEELTPEQREGAFTNFSIRDKTIEKLKDTGVKYLFPIQARTFNHVFEGNDVIAQARTGTGKTLSFALPLVEKLDTGGKNKERGRPPKVLVLAPTRELAKQVHDNFQALTDNLQMFCIYGGTQYYPQENAIRNGLDVLVGTPGRILDYVRKGSLNLSKLQHVVLDEVDQMLDMGFAESVDEILQSAYNKEDGANPQTLLFSATLPAWVHDTAKKYMRDDVKRVDLIGSQNIKTATTVKHLAIKCSYQDRAATLGSVLKVYSGDHGRAMVFCPTKKDADELAVSPEIKQDCHVLHGDVPQQKREMVLKGFREGKYRCLITTDVAARGLDIPEVDLVIQCAPPKDVDSYIHRSGRTGRAGRSGICVLFYKFREEADLQWVERKAGIKFKRIGAPTPEDIIKASAGDAAKSLDSVSDEALSLFEKSAQELIEERGAVKALAAALAVISGSTAIVARSLLSSQEGYTTYLFRTNIEMNGMGYAWRGLERHIPQEIKDSFKGMRFCKDRMGCVFDAPSEHDEKIEQLWQDGRFDTLQKATELPELLESEQNGFGGQRRSFGGGRGSPGGFRNGRGGGGFRGNGRGRGGGGSRGFNRSSNFNSTPQNKKITF